MESWTNELRPRYPSNCIRLSFKSSQDRGVCFLLNVVDLGFHVVLYPSKSTRAYNCWSSICSNMIWSLKSIFMGRRKIIICSCRCFRLWKLIRKQPIESKKAYSRVEQNKKLPTMFITISEMFSHLILWGLDFIMEKVMTAEQTTIMVRTLHCAQQSCLWRLKRTYELW